jgi:hypothetical protein
MVAEWQARLCKVTCNRNLSGDGPYLRIHKFVNAPTFSPSDVSLEAELLPLHTENGNTTLVGHNLGFRSGWNLSGDEPARR